MLRVSGPRSARHSRQDGQVGESRRASACRRLRRLDRLGLLLRQADDAARGRWLFVRSRFLESRREPRGGQSRPPIEKIKRAARFVDIRGDTQVTRRNKRRRLYAQGSVG